MLDGAMGISGKAKALDSIRDYVEGQGGYEKNAHKLRDEPRQRIAERWGYAFERWGYDKT